MSLPIFQTKAQLFNIKDMDTQNNAEGSKDNHNEAAKRDKENLIMALVKMRVEKFATTKTMLDFLMAKPFNYRDSYAYELIRESKKRINQIFKEEYEQSYHNAMARLEEIIETTKNEKTRLEAQKEMNKLLGLYKPQRVDVTSNGRDLQIGEVVVKIVNSKDEEN